jgi:uncharacterized integral membrane protein (TIGR00697 family)
MKKTSIIKISKDKKPFWEMISISGYIFAQILADIGSLKIANIGGLSIDGGTFIYPLTFTLRDMVHKVLGKKLAKQVIITAGVFNILMVLFFQLLVALPADVEWIFQSEFATILGPLWQITLASVIAEVISQLVDTEAYSFFIKKISEKNQWGRVLFSNLLAIPVDSIIFAFIAFWGILPVSVIWSIILANILVKSIVSAISFPSIYLIPDNLIPSDKK